jgi:hypothetical protein
MSRHLFLDEGAPAMRSDSGPGAAASAWTVLVPKTRLGGGAKAPATSPQDMLSAAATRQQVRAARRAGR